MTTMRTSHFTFADYFHSMIFHFSLFKSNSFAAVCSDDACTAY